MIQSARQIAHEDPSRVRIARADVPAWNQLAVRANRRPRPYVTKAEFTAQFLRHVLLFGVDKIPNLVTLDSAAIQSAQVLVLVLLAGGRYVREQFQHGMFCRVRDSASAINGIAFNQTSDDFCAPL